MEIVDFIRDPRILPCSRFSFRPRLSVQHMDKAGGDVQEVDIGAGVELIMTFQTNPLRLPIEPYVYAGFYDKGDPFLQRLVEYYMHINPAIDEVGIKRMTEFIVAKKVRRDSNERPVLSFEDIKDTVEVYAHKGKNKVLPCYRRVTILYDENTGLTKDERRIWSRMENGKKVKALMEEWIHMAAQMAIDRFDNMVRVNNPKVFDELTDLQREQISNIRKMSRNMSEETRDMIEESNIGRFFSSERLLDKYEKFLLLPAGLSMNQQAKQLQTSKRTIAEFIQIRKRLNM